jgi:hypothetical protein
MDGLGIGQIGRSAARTTSTNTPNPTQLKVLCRARADSPRTHFCHKSRQLGGTVFAKAPKIPISTAQ